MQTQGLDLELMYDPECLPAVNSISCANKEFLVKINNLAVCLGRVWKILVRKFDKIACGIPCLLFYI
jgi:hypothetical protein